VVAAQGDMELVGVADLVPSISHRALVERGSPYNLYRAFAGKEEALIEAGISASGTLEELNQTADVFFHGYANYENSVNADILKLTSNNTTGLIGTIHWLYQAVGVEKAAIMIVRLVADPGDTFRGLTNNTMIEAVPNHQAADLMTIMPHVDCTGAMLVQTPVTHKHISDSSKTTNTLAMLHNKKPRSTFVKLGFLMTKHKSNVLRYFLTFCGYTFLRKQLVYQTSSVRRFLQTTLENPAFQKSRTTLHH